jgi:hypothetical protein
VQLDLVEPGGLENPARGLGVTERKWPRPAGVGFVLVRAREEPLNNLLGVRQNGLSALRRQQTLASLPPGLSAPRIARIARTGAAKNCVPIREEA